MALRGDRKRTPWTPEDRDTLARLAADFLSGPEIARVLGRTTRAVYAKAAELGWSIHGERAEAARVFIADGGVLMRDAHPTQNDEERIHWTSAHRSFAGDLPTAFLERLVAIGVLVPVFNSDHLYRKAKQ